VSGLDPSEPLGLSSRRLPGALVLTPWGRVGVSLARLLDGLWSRLSRRLRCLAGRLLGAGCGAALVDEVAGLAARAEAARRGLEEGARLLYREGRLEEGLLVEALAEEIREVEDLLGEVEYLLRRMGLGEGLSQG